MRYRVRKEEYDDAAKVEPLACLARCQARLESAVCSSVLGLQLAHLVTLRASIPRARKRACLTCTCESNLCSASCAALWLDRPRQPCCVANLSTLGGQRQQSCTFEPRSGVHHAPRAGPVGAALGRAAGGRAALGAGARAVGAGQHARVPRGRGQARGQGRAPGRARAHRRHLQPHRRLSWRGARALLTVLCTACELQYAMDVPADVLATV